MGVVPREAAVPEAAMALWPGCRLWDGAGNAREARTSHNAESGYWARRCNGGAWKAVHCVVLYRQGPTTAGLRLLATSSPDPGASSAALARTESLVP